MHNRGQRTSTTPIHMTPTAAAEQAKTEQNLGRSLYLFSTDKKLSSGIMLCKNVRRNSAEEKSRLVFGNRRRASQRESRKRAQRFVIGNVAKVFIREPRGGRHRNQQAFVIGPRETQRLSRI